MLEIQTRFTTGTIMLALVLTLASSAVCADRAIANGMHREADAAMLVIATVVDAHGSPVHGAVVVTSDGGQGVTDRNGAVRFSAPLNQSREIAQVTAVAAIDGVNLVGSVPLPLDHRTNARSALDAGTITLQANGDCEPGWLPAFGGSPGTIGITRAAAIFDAGDGEGPALYVGGEFSMAGNVATPYIAKWDGESWSAVGAGVDGVVYALAVFDDGSTGGPMLYAGGTFNTAGGIPVGRIARWDGEDWHDVGGGTNLAVRTLRAIEVPATGKPVLYASGSFSIAGGVPANRIAMWDGEVWSPLGSGINGIARAFAYFDDGSGPFLYVGGTFTEAGGKPAERIATWDGQSWTPLDIGVNDHVNALVVFDAGSGPALYAGGQFTHAGTTELNHVGRWDGKVWSGLGTGMSATEPWTSTIIALTVFDEGHDDGPLLYAGGSFHTAGGVDANFIARWDGDSWSGLGDGMNSAVYTFAVCEGGMHGSPTLFTAGVFSFADGKAVRGVARWGGDSWIALPSGGLDNTVFTLMTHADQDTGEVALYAAGALTTAGDVIVNSIARWDGSKWSSLGEGFGNPQMFEPAIVYAIAMFDDGLADGPSLYAGGYFDSAEGKPVQNIARWDGDSWHRVGTGIVDGGVLAMAVFDDGSGSGPALYVGGDFDTFGEMTVNNIARWDGISWSSVGNGTSAAVHALTVFDDGTGSGPALYAGGDFQQAGGKSVSRIARWDGASWSDVGGGANSRIETLLAHNGDYGPVLYAGGAFQEVGDIAASRVAVWDGEKWSALGKGISGGGSIVNVWDLEIHDDGTAGGPKLYASGKFTVAGVVAADSIAMWDGSSWTPVANATWDGPEGVIAAVLAMKSCATCSDTGPILFAGGSFLSSTAGDSFLARFQGCTLDIPGDLDGDGMVDGLDLLILLTEWGACPAPDDCPADLNGDGVVDGLDVLILLANWG